MREEAQGEGGGASCWELDWPCLVLGTDSCRSGKPFATIVVWGVPEGDCRGMLEELQYAPPFRLQCQPGGKLSFRGLVARPDGSQACETSRMGAGSEAEAVAMGADAGQELRRQMGLPDPLG